MTEAVKDPKRRSYGSSSEALLRTVGLQCKFGTGQLAMFFLEVVSLYGFLCPPQATSGKPGGKKRNGRRRWVTHEMSV